MHKCMYAQTNMHVNCHNSSVFYNYLRVIARGVALHLAAVKLFCKNRAVRLPQSQWH